MVAAYNIVRFDVLIVSAVVKTEGEGAIFSLNSSDKGSGLSEFENHSPNNSVTCHKARIFNQYGYCRTVHVTEGLVDYGRSKT
jgi:hypothetical protein